MNLICGINPVLEALAAGDRHFDRILIVKGLRNRRLSDAIRRATRLGIPLRFEMRETLDRLAAGVPHQGLIAVVSAKPVLSLEQLVAGARQPALFVALDGVEDPRNLGAILRTAEAAGADGVLLPERHSAGLSETVGRASAGALEHVQVARVGNLVQALEALKARGIWAVGLDAAGGERWDTVDLRRPVVLVLGGEGRGIRRLVREHCDHLVSIPHFGHVSSLNVSVAAGVALYEAVRQRGAIPSAVRPIPVRPPVTQVVGPDAHDEEIDPGATPLPPPLDDDAHPLAMEADDGLEPASLPRVDIHGDDVAWGQGPTVLRPIGFRRGRHLPGRRRGAAERRRSPEPARRGEDSEGTDRRGAEPEAAPSPPRGRRRRRRKRSVVAGPAPENQNPAATGPQEASVSEAGPASDRSERPGRAGKRRRGRRRKRRR